VVHFGRIIQAAEPQITNMMSVLLEQYIFQKLSKAAKNPERGVSNHEISSKKITFNFNKAKGT
jgi:hypothetical protein